MRPAYLSVDIGSKRQRPLTHLFSRAAASTNYFVSSCVRPIWQLAKRSFHLEERILVFRLMVDKL